ncbi:MAG: 3-phosphoserine/phosphohydroxythreonine transaminase [Burkholderiales bacterium]|jgi:phosphoserine aminotransferase|nr:3-phosphoserine/phosphohydroxythreonine transaminase [Burkholderiales bacterium]
MARPFNFNPGPATLPESVLKQVQQELLDYQGRGLSVMEMSHRSEAFLEIAANAERDLRALLNLSSDYTVLFLQGGAKGQNAAVPLNLLGNRTTIDFVHTGHWSKNSIEEAKKYAQVHLAASAESSGFYHVPPQSEWQMSDNPAYLHICANETITGVEYSFTPKVSSVPLVADMSSNFLSREIEVNRFGLIYAGAQKNVGPAGVTIVIVKNDLLDRALPICPSIWHYATQKKHEWMLNTPPTFAIYVSGLVFAWLRREGGLAAMEKRNQEKADRLYALLDRGDFYRGKVHKKSRSRMNVTFDLPNETLTGLFVEEAKENGLINLKGHKISGGIRASIYNAMPIEGVDALIAFMEAFEKKNG